MFYINTYQPPVYVQPEVFYEEQVFISSQSEVVYDPPAHVRSEQVYIPAYPTFEMRQTIKMPNGTTIIIDRSRERFYVEPQISY